MKTILLPTDFSVNSLHAIKYAVNLFRYEECRYILVNAYQTPKAGAAMMVSIEDILEEESEKELKDLEKKIRDEFHASVLDIERVSYHGDVVTVLNRTGKKYNASMIAMGTKGASGLAGMVMGSVTAAVLKGSDLPVVAIPNKSDFDGIRKIGIVWDKRKNAKSHIFEPVIQLAKEFDAQIEIVHVGDKELVEAKEAELAPDFNYVFRQVEHHFTEVQTEDVEAGLLEFTTSKGIDLLVMVARKHDWFDRLIHGSHSAAMVKDAEVPLLVLKDD